jgi:hypothetical protein
MDNCLLTGKFGGGRGVSILVGFRWSLEGGVVAEIGRGVRRTNWKVESDQFDIFGQDRRFTTRNWEKTRVLTPKISIFTLNNQYSL